jgi:hypothetical protein
MVKPTRESIAHEAVFDAYKELTGDQKWLEDYACRAIAKKVLERVDDFEAKNAKGGNL